VTSAGRLQAEIAPKDIVRRGYDAVSNLNRAEAEEPKSYGAGSRRSGSAFRPLARYSTWAAVAASACRWPQGLAASGYAVTGVDISAVQVQRARQLVPGAAFLHADATWVRFPPSSVDAVVSRYALIHMPLDE
jgi:SAM-dependent methyltransferase